MNPRTSPTGCAPMARDGQGQNAQAGLATHWGCTLWVAAIVFPLLGAPDTNAQTPPPVSPTFEDTRPLPGAADELTKERARAEAEARARKDAERRAAEAEKRRLETEATLKEIQEEAKKRAEQARRELERQQAAEAAPRRCRTTPCGRSRRADSGGRQGQGR